MVEALLLSLALAMDAFAVALTQGARFRPVLATALGIAVAFGAMQGAMAALGWLLGEVTLVFIAAFDHWIAFALLGFIGIQMIRGEAHEEALPRLTGRALLVASVATSVDAFAAGVTLPTLAYPALPALAMIAGVTFVLSLVGVWLGRMAGDRFGRPAEIFGGVVLIGLGIKIVLEHTGII